MPDRTACSPTTSARRTVRSPERDDERVRARDRRCAPLAVEVMFDGDRVHVVEAVSRHGWVRPPRFADHDADQAGSGPVSPLPGTVIAVHVEAGQTVEDGTLLMVVEAMKMEHKITAHAAAVVSEVRFRAGDRVDAGDLLVVLESP
jgi:propionyl-CoA carboxylase alpha chain